jgi:hypothetical protein
MAAAEYIKASELIVKGNRIPAPLTNTFVPFKHLPAQVGLCLS